MTLAAMCPDHGALTQNLDDLHSEVTREREERRENDRVLFGKIDEFGDGLAGVTARLATLEGRIAGYLLAGSILTTVLVLLSQWLMQHVAKGSP